MIKIVVLPQRFVAVGDVTKESDEEIVIRKAAIIRSWNAQNGLGGIAKKGPTQKTILDHCPPIRAHEQNVAFTIDCKKKNWGDLPDDTWKKSASKTQIVVFEQGFMAIGKFSKKGREIAVKQNAVIGTWGTTRGLGEIAHFGPTEKTTLFPGPPIRTLHTNVIFRMDCNEGGWKRFFMKTHWDVELLGLGPHLGYEPSSEGCGDLDQNFYYGDVRGDGFGGGQGTSKGYGYGYGYGDSSGGGRGIHRNYGSAVTGKGRGEGPCRGYHM